MSSPTALPIGTKPVRPALEIGLLMLLSLIWGSSFTLIKLAVESIPPATMVSARIAVAAVLLTLLARSRGLQLPRDRRTWGECLVQGMLQSAVPFTLITWGEQHIASGLAGVLNATPPIFVLLIALATGPGAAKGSPPVGGRKILGVGLGLAGVVFTIGVQSVRDMGTAAPLAQTAVLAASLCYALAAIWGRRLARLPAIVAAAGAMTCATVVMLPAALVLERPWTLTPTPGAVAAVAVLAVVCTALAMVIYFRLVRTLGSLGTTSGSYLRAGFSVALGILFLGESFTWSTLLGMAFIVLGVVVVTTPGIGLGRFGFGRLGLGRLGLGRGHARR